ncbi:MAG: T9SS type B sorting domain-containing protein [Flavobacteriaceae bacterium]|nr:T9SS type B sorting domain-containing protein [Flavobacteriaceae bacterium]
MKLKFPLTSIVILLILLCNNHKMASQCFQIKSILVDACGGLEGLNEMVRIETGSTPLNLADFTVSWPNNGWQGLVQNAMTASVIQEFNADIAEAGGCGQIIAPVGGIIPPNSTFILFTSYNVNIEANSFGALNHDIFAIFQNNGSVSTGHFANFGSGVRSLTVTSGACSQTVYYDRSFLTGGDGATVEYDNTGQPTYINNGCSAPISFWVEAGEPQTACPGDTIQLEGSFVGGETVLWSATGGTFSSANSLQTSFTIDQGFVGTSIIITLSLIDVCDNTINDTVEISITGSLTPDFATTATYCSGSAIPALATTSPNGITGTWLPATVDATASGTYIFTPDAGQCAASVTLSVTITDGIVPDFATTATYCSGSAIPALATTSPNGITGTWLPATVDATTSGTYVFTPDVGQCAASVTLAVTITDGIVPDFATTATYCSGSAIPALATTSPNGITGTWLPATVDATTSGTYVFTPDVGQCAASVTLSVTITDGIVPDFATTATYCSGSAIPALATTSSNGITGTWLPATIDATASGTYIFTPDAGQCATSVTLSVTITNLQTPNVAFTYPSDLCANSENIFPDLANDFYDGGQFSSDTGLIINIETGEVNIGESPTGLHTITYSVLPNGEQCIAGANSSFDIVIHETETIAITGENSVCIGSTIALQANQNGNWTSSNPDIASVNNQGVVTGLASGQVEVIFTNHSANCPITISKTIQVNALPEVSLQDGTICLDTESGAVVTPYTLTTGLPAQGNTFVWKHNGELLLQTTSNLTVTTAGNYEVTVTNNLTGCSATAQATVSFSTPISGYAVVGEDFHNMQTITVYITGGSGYFSYQLDGGLMQTTSQFTGHFQGDYTITVRDSLGCNDLVLEVTVLNYPRFFTPNDDGFNDFWNISGVNNDAQLYIFDRYGKLLKQLQPNTLTGWDGTYNGEQLPSTDYWFKLIYRNDLGAEKEFKAHFSLKR